MTRISVPLTLRQRAIVQVLVQSSGHVTYDELSHATDLSVRVIRYNMGTVRAWFASNGAKLTSRSGYGIEIDRSSAQRRQLLAALTRSVDQDLVLAGVQRRRAFLFQMLCSDSPQSFQNLARQADSSRSTLIHDVGKMDDWLERFRIRIIRRPKRGIYLAAEEHMRRFAIAAVLREELEEDRWRRLTGADTRTVGQDRSLPLYIRTYLERLDLPFFGLMLTNVENNLGRRLTPASHVSVLIYLAIMGQALRAGKTMVPLAGEGAIKGLELDVSLILLRDLSRHWGTEISRSEGVLLAAYLLGLDWENPGAAPPNKLPSGPEADAEALAYAREIVAKCALQLHPLLQIDQELLSGLARHLERAIHRLRHDIPIRNALLEPVRTRYAEVHRSAAQSVTSLEQKIGARFSEDELAFVSMYLAAALERIGTNRRFVRPVLLVAEGDLAKTTLLRSRLESEFPNLEIVGVCEPAAASAPDSPRAELVIALVPYEHPTLPTLLTGPFLITEEIRAIRTWLATKESQDRRVALSQRAKLGIVELLDPSSIVFHAASMEWRDAVDLAAGPLIRAGRITRKYVTAMIQILEEFGPYMILAPGVILLHAKPSDGVNSLCFSLLLHRTGIDFGGSFGKVYVVFVLGAVDIQSHLTALFQVSNLIQNPRFIRRLRQAVDPADALRTIWSYLTGVGSTTNVKGSAQGKPAE